MISISLNIFSTSLLFILFSAFIDQVVPKIDPEMIYEFEKLYKTAKVMHRTPANIATNFENKYLSTKIV
jgi:uncharacterized membrane protein SpoIIM required for sporulation